MKTKDAVERAIADMPSRVPFELTEQKWLPHVAWQAGYLDALHMVMFWAKNLDDATPQQAEQMRLAAQAVLNRPFILTEEQRAEAIYRQNSLLTPTPEKESE